MIKRTILVLALAALALACDKKIREVRTPAPVVQSR